jgi:serine/threonine-protein kinase HipA
MRRLEVFIAAQPVGSLSENQGFWSFQYHAEWIRTGYPLSPGLPLTETPLVDSGSLRPVQWFFDNLLPEDAARIRLLASLPVGQGDAWDLLAHYGSESAGALTLLPPGAPEPHADVRPLSDAELNARIMAMPRIPLGSTAPKKMSLAGAQEKLPIVVDAQGALFDPIGAAPSTHILKPDVMSPRYPSSAVNEWFCARLGQALKLPIPQVTLRYVPATAYIIERFDRRLVGDQRQRVHTLDAAQLLSLAAGAKYAQSGAAALGAVIGLCRAKAPTRIALFRWTLFNALIGNGDAHLKNLSFYAGREGYALAPHYDLVSTAAWARPELAGAGESTWPDIELSFPVGNARRFRDLTPADWYPFGEALRLPASAVQRELRHMIAAIRPAADALLAEFQQRTDIPPMQRAGELRMIHAIIHLPIKTMARRLDAR